MKVFYLYKIVNSVNDKVYIGVTSRPKERKREHFRETSKCSKLLRAMNKYGRENFEMIILCAGTEDYIIDLEFKAITSYDSINNGYNILLGHPNQVGISMPQESKDKMSRSLKEFYKNNPGHLKGRKRKQRADIPYYISGFWFPSQHVGLESLCMNEKTFYKRRSEETLGECCHPVANSVSHSPVYVLGIWFDSLITAMCRLNRSKEFLQLLIRKADLEESLLRVNTKKKTKLPGDPIGVNKREYGDKWRAVMIHKGEILLKKAFDSQNEAATAYDDCYESVHGTRPNNTIGNTPKKQQ